MMRTSIPCAAMAPLLLLACHTGPSVKADALPPLHPDVAAFDWLAGRWQSPEGALEVWVPLGDALLGMSCSERPAQVAGWEVMMIRRDKAGMVFAAMPNGAAETVFAHAGPEPRAATFRNAGHDFPTWVTYARTDDAKEPSLGAKIGDASRAIDFAFAPAPSVSAPELVEQDRAFARDSAARRVDAWLDRFEEAGGIGRGPLRIEGRDKLREALGETLAPGTQLEWEPATSVLCKAGDLGFTAGPWRFFVEGAEGKKEVARGLYVTVWRKDASGAWRILYDVGDPEGAPR